METAVTQSKDYWFGKGINYKMNPQNIRCLKAGDIDCCVLANNHVLDWGYTGLEETLDTLKRANIKIAGAGNDSNAAQKPAILTAGDQCRVLIFALGSPTSGVPYSWAATEVKGGVNFLPDFSQQQVARLADQIQTYKRPGDIIVVSIHWGGNWGYRVPEEQRRFAHRLIDQAGVDVIHGHSSHHPKGLEIYRNKPIIYGCGDFINDYEGISGHESYRSELSLMYFVYLDPEKHDLIRFELTPMRIKGFQLQFATVEETRWLAKVLNRESRKFQTQVVENKHHRLAVQRL